MQRIQGLLRRVHEVPPGGCRWTARQAEEGHLQPRALREHRRVDRGTCLERAHGQRVCSCHAGGRFQDAFSLFSPLQAHWWAVLLMGIALIMLMAGFIKICSVHTPSSNPKLPPPKPLPGEICQEASDLSVFFRRICRCII